MLFKSEQEMQRFSRYNSEHIMYKIRHSENCETVAVAGFRLLPWRCCVSGTIHHLAFKESTSITIWVPASDRQIYHHWPGNWLLYRMGSVLCKVESAPVFKLSAGGTEHPLWGVRGSIHKVQTCVRDAEFKEYPLCALLCFIFCFY